MKIIGIDPGLTKSGWGIIEARGQNYTYINCGVIAPRETDISKRLLTIFTKLTDVIEDFKPETAAVEKTFINKDGANSLKLGYAGAMALLAPSKAGLEVSQYAPNTIKNAVVGLGHATKDQVEYMIRVQLKGFQNKGHDSTDALAIALTHSLLSPQINIEMPCN
ncbi:MAG: crossover junction endodeoxyribonuclease RuvC [Rhodobacteraceae bacterium]|nr:crossover junction endodeoxyribonuclease RuvC [Paracoccaceae bacterium]